MNFKTKIVNGKKRIIISATGTKDAPKDTLERMVLAIMGPGYELKKEEE